MTTQEEMNESYTNGNGQGCTGCILWVVAALILVPIGLGLAIRLFHKAAGG